MPNVKFVAYFTVNLLKVLKEALSKDFLSFSTNLFLFITVMGLLLNSIP